MRTLTQSTKIKFNLKLQFSNRIAIDICSISSLTHYHAPLLIYLFFFCISINANAQTGKAIITGTVLDATTKEPIDFATITVFKSGTKSVVNGISSDIKGNFTVLGLPGGVYNVSVDFIGHKAQAFPVIVSQTSSTISLGTILLTSAVDQLQSVTIIAKTPIIENKIDKTIYNTENDLTAQNGVALDV